jgi:hypothetical protein
MLPHERRATGSRRAREEERAASAAQTSPATTIAGYTTIVTNELPDPGARAEKRSTTEAAGTSTAVKATGTAARQELDGNVANWQPSYAALSALRRSCWATSILTAAAMNSRSGDFPSARSRLRSPGDMPAQIP